MNRKLYLVAGVLVLMSIALIFFMKSQTLVFMDTERKEQKARNTAANVKEDSQATISVLPVGAFGDLASLGSGVNNGVSGQTMALGLNGGGGMVSPEMASAETAKASLSVTSGSRQSETNAPISAIASDMKTMPPYYGFKYVYKGEALNLEDASAAVYRRVKGDDVIAKKLADLISNLDISGFNISAFSNLKATNLTLTEDKDLGLVISFDFNEGNINIYENWEKWAYPERDACGNDQACWDRYRLKISDVPADTDLISLANKFLADHKVNLDHYGTPLVDNYWRDNYEQTADKTNFYIPEYISVIYPLLVDGQVVRDQSGNYAGLRITINLNKKAASGLSGLVPYRYESSQYDLETSAEAIIKLAENGGWNGNYYMQTENVQTIELGTPEKSYVQIYRYANNRNEELLVPALIFPVISTPAAVNYYGQKYVAVPLVKEMLNNFGNQPVPMPLILRAGGGTSGSSGSATGVMEVVPVTEPADLMR